MSQIKGIDVSYANGKLNWEKLKSQVDFAIARGGYATTVDVQAARNLSECNRLGIPVGAYWFSYATDVDKAILEARVCCEFLKPYKVDLPVAFDFEYASVEYAKKRSVDVDASLMCKMAIAFLDTVKQYGYTPMLYTNLDFLNRGFSYIQSKYKLWLAQWTTSKPSKDYYIWQNTDRLSLSGAECFFDGNVADSSILTGKEGEKEMPDDLKKRYFDRVFDEYSGVAKQVLDGKYGNGDERKKRLKEAGYDYIMVQSMVNELIK